MTTPINNTPPLLELSVYVAYIPNWPELDFVRQSLEKVAKFSYPTLIYLPIEEEIPGLPKHTSAQFPTFSQDATGSGVRKFVATGFMHPSISTRNFAVIGDTIAYAIDEAIVKAAKEPKMYPGAYINSQSNITKDDWKMVVKLRNIRLDTSFATYYSARVLRNMEHKYNYTPGPLTILPNVPKQSVVSSHQELQP